MLCPTNPVPEQLLHSAVYALAVLGVGVFALAIDVFASVLGRLGATSATVRLLHGAALWLLGTDLVVMLTLATASAARVVWCFLN